MILKDGGQLLAGEVWLHASVYGECFSLISTWELLHWNDDLGTASWRLQERPELWSTDQIVGVCISRFYPDRVLTLIPPHLR